MKTKTTAFCSLALTLLLLPAPVWSQVQWASPNALQQGGVEYSQPMMPPQQVGHPPPQVLMQTSFCGGCGAPAASCTCPVSNGSCSGDCGGSCQGGCGGKSGILGSLLGRTGGAFGGAGGHGHGGCWLDAEYLLWWTKERYIPALVTTSPNGTIPADAGVLGLPSTSILFGDDLVGGGPHSGFRVSGGKWLGDQETVGIGGSFFSIEGDEDFSQSSNAMGEPILARPFFDTVLAAENSLLVAYPGDSNGSINVTAENRVRGFDVYLRKLLLAGYCNRIDVIGGYHYSEVEDTVDIQNSLIATSNVRIPIGSQIATQDFFEVTNEFQGGFVGLMATAEDGRLSWKMLAKLAFGNMNQEARISGRTESSVPGAGSSTSNFGLLALPTNIGTFDQDEFALVPELNVTVGLNVTKRFQLTLGYSFIYWSEVALAGDMIDTTINTSQLVGPLVGVARPAASLQSDGFWYTGLNVGGSIRF